VERLERADMLSVWQSGTQHSMEKMEVQGEKPRQVDLLTLEMAGKLGLLNDSCQLKMGYVLVEPYHNLVNKVPNPTLVHGYAP